MAVTEETRRQLFQRAGGQCECTMSVCSHHRAGSRCPHKLNPGWEAHHRSTGGPDTLGNLVALCVTCHKNTPSYGRG